MFLNHRDVQPSPVRGWAISLLGNPTPTVSSRHRPSTKPSNAPDCGSLGPKASAIRRITGLGWGSMSRGNGWGRIAQKRNGSAPDGAGLNISVVQKHTKQTLLRVFAFLVSRVRHRVRNLVKEHSSPHVFRNIWVLQIYCLIMEHKGSHWDWTKIYIVCHKYEFIFHIRCSCNCECR